MILAQREAQWEWRGQTLSQRHLDLGGAWESGNMGAVCYLSHMVKFLLSNFGN